MRVLSGDARDPFLAAISAALAASKKIGEPFTAAWEKALQMAPNAKRGWLMESDEPEEGCPLDFARSAFEQAYNVKRPAA